MEFRGREFINRVREINFLKSYFEGLPDRILWIYGPKSTGKTTLIEYVIENELFDDFSIFKSKKYNVKYINFRRKAITNYESFINSFVKPKDNDLSSELKLSFNLWGFRIEPALYKKIKEKKEDIFDILLEEFKKQKKKNILIIDEIQKLEDIYIDNEKLLLNEFLNFCVSLTKETHISHVVILSSNTIFVNEIYNNAKLKETSEFYKIDHLPFDEVKKWLSGGYNNKYKFSEKEINLIWEYLGGNISDIQKLLFNYCTLKTFTTLKEYLENEAKLATSEIKMCFYELAKQDIYADDIFKEIAKEIVNNGYAILKNDKKYIEIVEYFCEKEILFFEPSDTNIYPNSQIYAKAMQKILKGN